jgi:uncharacterized protein (TIGR00159 family)
VALLFYVVLIFIRQTRSYFIIYTLLFLSGVYYLSTWLDLGLTRQIFQPFLTFSVFLFAIVFQRDLRRFFDWFFISGRKWMWDKKRTRSIEVTELIVRAVAMMAQSKTGALLVFPGDYPLDSLIEGGTALEGRISIPLLLSIFDSTSPGHDGAVIIENNRLRRFGVHLPLAENYQGFDKTGTRHRAGAGITERSDALAIIVSEERGEISIAEGGKLRLIKNVEELERQLTEFIKGNVQPVAESAWHYFWAKNTYIKIASVSLALIFWLIYSFSGGVVSQTFTVPLETRFLAKDLTIDQVLPENVEVTVSGRERDLRSFGGQQIKVFVDVPEATAGWAIIHLTKDNVVLPPYVSLTKIFPQTVQIVLKKN